MGDFSRDRLGSGWYSRAEMRAAFSNPPPLLSLWWLAMSGKPEYTHRSSRLNTCVVRAIGALHNEQREQPPTMEVE